MSEQHPLKEKLGIRDKVLVTQKLWRLKANEAIGVVIDLLTPLEIGEEGNKLDYVSKRAELRTQANAVNMSRYVLEKEIGSERSQEFLENAYHFELIGLPQDSQEWYK